MVLDLACPQLALLIIAACGFGVQFSWTEPPSSRAADGTERMSMQEALRIVSETIVLAAFSPSWVKLLPLAK